MPPPSLRLLLFPSSSYPLSKSPFLGYSLSRSLFCIPRPPLKPRSPLTALCYSGARRRRSTGGGGGGGSGGRKTSGGGGSRGGGVFHQRRRASTLREERDRARAPEMEGKEETLGFNKRRAEGRDKSDKPKALQLKSRKLNPVNIWGPSDLNYLVDAMRSFIPNAAMVAGTRTARYRAVPPKIDRRRLISIVGGRLKGEIGRRRSIEREKGRKKKWKKKKKKEKRRKRIPIARARSWPVRRRRPRVAGALSPARGERSRR
ncbi:hypothetical protein BHE74_00019153, partial [Ensete ventricosum]